jgi:o-succinylbenzoate---CoA ligase
MPATPLVATLLSNPDIADIAVRCWNDGEAIAPIPISAPRAEITERLARIRPTHLVDEHGRHTLADGIPVDDDTAAVVTTSGTTASPKLVELTRSGMEIMGRGYSHAVGANDQDRWLACMPLHHVASLAIVARAYVCGLPFVVHQTLDLDRVARSHADDDATMVSLVPTVLHRLIEAGAPLERFRCLIIGGAVLPAGLRARAEARGAHVVDAYGLTETWGGCAINGSPNNGVGLRLGANSEVEVRGAPVMRGYRFALDDTHAVFTDDGWFRTGDVGTFVDGRLQVIDRIKDVIITGGVNVSPTKVEDVLIDHPAIDDVTVIGLPDDEWGERVVAIIVVHHDAPPPSLAALRDFARDRLSAPELPRDVRTVNSIPRTPGGKALRRLVRDAVVSE